MVVLKHNWERYLEPFSGIVRKNLHRNNDGILQCTINLNWLELPGEDLHIYIFGNKDDKCRPQCIVDIASVGQDGETYLLCKKREAAPKKLG